MTIEEWIARDGDYIKNQPLVVEGSEGVGKKTFLSKIKRISLIF